MDLWQYLTMNETWHKLTNFNNTEQGEITADTEISKESKWFEGHFPGYPVLPGIAQISMVVDAIKEAAQKDGHPVVITGIKKVRFRQLITTDADLRVEIKKDKTNTYHYRFKITNYGQLACNGMIITEKH